MSAYILDRSQIRFLVSVAQLWEVSWFHAGAYRRIHRVDEAAAAACGQMLWDENVRSVRHRYPGELELPGPIDCDYQYGRHNLAWGFRLGGDLSLQVLRMLACYEYQACETPDWRDTEAYAFCRNLQAHAIRNLPGYDDAEPNVAAMEDATTAPVRIG